MWWGFSEALDLVDELPDVNNRCESGDSGDGSETSSYNVLLIGQHDCRHVLKTMAQKYRHDKGITLNLYVHEPLLENVARQLLFLTLALEPADHVGITEKTIFYMELYGNSLLRPATNNYLKLVSKRLLNVVTDVTYGRDILPAVILDHLKYKERDQLEVIFKYWAKSDNTFDIMTAWNERVRKDLGIRYDARNGVFDWDYHMRYHCFGADILKLHEYKRFRERGISFYFDGTDPCMANVTLASAIFASGSKILNYGYMGDITTGPYPGHGFACEDQDMFKRVNDQLPKASTDVTERNLMRIFHELQNGTAFVPCTTEEDTRLPAILEDTTSALKIVPDESGTTDRITIRDACDTYTSLPANNCRVHFLPTTALRDTLKKPEYEGAFDLVYVSQTMVLKYVQPELAKTFKPNGRIVVDTPKFLLNYRKEALETFKSNLVSLMDSCGCKLVGSYDSETDQFARFQVEK